MHTGACSMHWQRISHKANGFCGSPLIDRTSPKGFLHLLEKDVLAWECHQCFMYQYKLLTITSKMSPITNLQKKVLFINISTALKVMFGDFGKSYVYFLYKLCLTLCREQDPVVPNSAMLGAQHLFHSQLRWYLLLVFCFVVVVLFLSPSVSVLVIGPPGTMQPYQSS